LEFFYKLSKLSEQGSGGLGLVILLIETIYFAISLQGKLKINYIDVVA